MPKLPQDDFDKLRFWAPLVSIDLIIRDPGGRILLGLRTNEPARGFWFVPGGRILKDERLAEAFRRTIEAELGAGNSLGVSPEISDAAFKGVYEHLYPRVNTMKSSIHYVVLAYELRAGRSELPAIPPLQHTQWRWSDVASLIRDPQVHRNTQAYFFMSGAL